MKHRNDLADITKDAFRKAGVDLNRLNSDREMPVRIEAMFLPDFLYPLSRLKRMPV